MKKKLTIFGIVLLILLAGMNIVKILVENNEAQSPFVLRAVMQGEYKVGDSEWKPIVKGEHIPASEGEVILRGTLHMIFPDGEFVGPVKQNAQLALYFDHIAGSVYINGKNSCF